MNDEPRKPTHIAYITGDMLGEKIDKLYTGVGELVSSMRQMTYLSGVLDTVNVVVTIEQAVRADQLDKVGDIEQPKFKPDIATLDWISRILQTGAAEGAKSLTFTDLEEMPQEAVPPRNAQN